MAKAKARKSKPQAEPDFVERKRQAMGFAPARVIVLGDERRRQLDTIRRFSPAMGWGWLTDAERASLVRYADLHDAAEVTVKGCLSPVGGGEPLLGAERRIARGEALKAARRACTAPALAFVDKALLGDNPPHLDALCETCFGAPRQAARMTGRAFIGIVARDLVKYFGA